jgi:hypothetical protein
LSCAENCHEAFLFEMPVIGENFGQSFPIHRLHRYTVGQAVALVRTPFIKRNPGQIRFMSLVQDQNVLVKG